MMAEEQVIRLLQQHADAAMLALVTEYGPLIRRVAWAQLGTDYARGYLDDVENRVYYKVWRKIDQFDPAMGSFTAWLSTITRNQAIDYQRGLKASLAALDLADLNVAAPAPADAPDLEALFAGLSPTEREVFTLFFVRTLTVAEIAQQLHMKPAAIYQHLSRGRRKIRQGGEAHGNFN